MSDDQLFKKCFPGACFMFIYRRLLRLWKCNLEIDVLIPETVVVSSAVVAAGVVVASGVVIGLFVVVPKKGLNL